MHEHNAETRPAGKHGGTQQGDRSRNIHSISLLFILTLHPCYSWGNGKQEKAKAGSGEGGKESETVNENAEIWIRGFKQFAEESQE